MTISGMARTGLAPEYVEALGMQAMSVIGLLSDLTMHELGCYVMKQPSAEQKALVGQYFLEGTKPQGWLYPEEALEIQNEPNTYRQVRLMKMYRQQKIKQAQADNSRNIQETAQAQSQAAQDTANAELQALQAKADIDKDLNWEKARADVWKNQQIVRDQVFLARVTEKLKAGTALDLEEERRYTELLKIKEQGHWDIMKEKAKPKPVVKPGGAKK